MIGLDKLRACAERLRDINFELWNLESRMGALRKEREKIASEDMIDVLDATNATHFGLEATGNMPACDFRVATVYSGTIPRENLEKATAWFDAEGHGDLLRSEIKLTFNKGKEDNAQALLRIIGQYEPSSITHTRGVHHATLAAFCREQIERRGAIIPLDLLGVRILRTVIVKESKND